MCCASSTGILLDLSITKTMHEHFHKLAAMNTLQIG
ncbi:Hypothetical protein PAU_01224 [Photorhabdus asymbiotica]|uniref:Uncharacterized protein n=1 Tax=Photorhabdus asymbiotica subsp. asymbiotica (strain ATCC 43949 / 3105-77) TaxID=553480 RepID=B6VKB8_PHOAA|nr:Hypothetical protein PAU_01224 [Photorhabdus asymbiotica]CAR66598.1 Hypothetical protein PA-RVA2-4260 [Photorhabdus asymbiotica subsp. asymbiotica ATCC 43949]